MTRSAALLVLTLSLVVAVPAAANNVSKDTELALPSAGGRSVWISSCSTSGRSSSSWIP